ncbi:unnamed protein product [Owenia fusiformis]|uniref:Uncharacterized protein n=1 Tax=Owenia fusiformis TaxID=6347 RepID=A0A8J1XFM3_OWEFU|nr:unnamed protein product [Owenia fusiformis]
MEKMTTRSLIFLVLSIPILASKTRIEETRQFEKRKEIPMSFIKTEEYDDEREAVGNSMECAFNESEIVQCGDDTHSCVEKCGTSYNLNTSEESVPPFVCQCDTLCSHYGDCCKDYIETCVSKKVSEDLQESKKDMYECTRIYGNVHVFLIKECQAEHQGGEMEEACKGSSHDIISRTPVMDVKHGHQYKNIYCAKCNNAGDHIQSWNVTILCLKGTLSNEELFNIDADVFFNLVGSGGKCRLEFKPPLLSETSILANQNLSETKKVASLSDNQTMAIFLSDNQTVAIHLSDTEAPENHQSRSQGSDIKTFENRLCFPMIRDCPDCAGSLLEKLCTTEGQNPLKQLSSSRTYYNWFCFRCNNRVNSMTQATCASSFKGPGGGFALAPFFSFQLLLDVTGKDAVDITVETKGNLLGLTPFTITCESKSQCGTRTCPVNYIRTGSTCSMEKIVIVELKCIIQQSNITEQIIHTWELNALVNDLMSDAISAHYRTVGFLNVDFQQNGLVDFAFYAQVPAYASIANIDQQLTDNFQAMLTYIEKSHNVAFSLGINMTFTITQNAMTKRINGDDTKEENEGETKENGKANGTEGKNKDTKKENELTVSRGYSMQHKYLTDIMPILLVPLFVHLYVQ